MRCLLVLLLAASALLAQQPLAPDLARHIHAEMDFLASDEMQGRESAGPFEAVAGAYLASQFEALGLAPGGESTKDGRSYFQIVPIDDQVITAPQLTLGNRSWKFGTDFRIARLTDAKFNGKLHFWKQGAAVPRGAVVFLPSVDSTRARVREMLRNGATAVLSGYGPEAKAWWEAFASETPTLSEGKNVNALLLSATTTAAIQGSKEGTPVSFLAEIKTVHKQSRNVIAMLPGKTNEVLMISAHYDHIGTKPGQSDPIYNGADDDASGTVAVLELARALAKGPQPRRTIYFALFGAEEPGSIGGGYFEQHPVVPLNTIVAQIEFEMIGRPDPKVEPGTLWMTGFDRSDLGPELAKRGAALVADPHPEQGFFERSDNYPLAKRGVIAHSISSFGLHAQYHQPDDDIAHIDFAHLTAAIGSMIAPVRWLADSDFKPMWEPGKQP